MTLPQIKYYWSFDEGEGNQAIDAVQGARMTIDPTSWVRDLPKSGLHLHPGNEPGELYGHSSNTNPPDFNVTTGSADQDSSKDDPAAIPDREPPWTAAMWLKHKKVGKDGAALFSARDFIFRLEQYEDTSARKVEITICRNKDITGTYQIPVGWVHLVLVGTSDGVKLYANGEHKDTLADYASGSNPKRPLDLPLRWIGSAQAYREGGTFLLDELKIFRGALTADQITALFNKQFPRTSSELLELAEYSRLSDRSGKLALEYHWRFDAGNIPEAVDAVQGVKRTQTIDVIQGAKITVSPVRNNIASAAWVAGRPKNGLSFEPAAKRIVTTDIPDRPPPWTAAMWVKREGRTEGAALLSSRDFGIKIEQWQNRGTIGITRFRDTDIDEPEEKLAYTTTLNAWEHLIFVGTAQDTKAYVNGELKATFSKSISLPLQWVGCSHGDVEYGAFMLDELKIYHTALTADQARELYRQVSLAFD